MDNLKRFNKQKYLTIETFRRNGKGVRTPVWFVQEGEILYVQTGANSGKVKRIRNNGRVNIAPCKMDGTLIGTWIGADARENKECEVSKKVNRLLDMKYGLMKKLLSATASRDGSQEIILVINIQE